MTAQLHCRHSIKYTVYMVYVIFSRESAQSKEKTCLCSELSLVCLFLRLIRSHTFLLWLTGYTQENFYTQELRVNKTQKSIHACLSQGCWNLLKKKKRKTQYVQLLQYQRVLQAKHLQVYYTTSCFKFSRLHLNAFLSFSYLVVLLKGLSYYIISYAICLKHK